MATLTTFIDGLHNFGSVELTIGLFSNSAITGGVAYIADDFTINRPSKVVEQTQQLDRPNGQRLYATFVTGSATLQLAAAATLTPVLFKAFSVTVYDTDEGGAKDVEWFVISEVGQPFQKDQETKVPISFRKILNPSTAVAS